MNYTDNLFSRKEYAFGSLALLLSASAVYLGIFRFLLDGRLSVSTLMILAENIGMCWLLEIVFLRFIPMGRNGISCALLSAIPPALHVIMLQWNHDQKWMRIPLGILAALTAGFVMALLLRELPVSKRRDDDRNRRVGTSRSGIRKVCRGRRKTTSTY